MKLIISIVKDNDASDLIDAVIDEGFKITKLATTGGFLKSGNSTLLIGAEEKDVDKIVKIINYICESKKEIEIETSQVKVGGATIFVVEVDKFIKI